MKAMSALVLLAVLGVASAVQAQTGTGQYPAGQNQYPTNQAQASGVQTAPDGSFTDECGFRYNSRGDRIDAHGRLLPEPHTSPGGGSCPKR
jgi:opacity protein-like surface antigen